MLLSTGLVPAAVAATLALGFLLLVRRFGFSTGLGVLASLALVFTTPVWVYGRTLGAENLIAALLVWTALSWIDAARTRRAWVLVAGGALLGACVHAHAVLVFLPLPVAAYWAWSRPGWRDAARAGALAGLGALPLLVAWFWRVHPEYGATLAFGLSAHPGLVEGWGAPALTGLYGAFLSPGKSLFLYAPLLLLGFVGLAAFWRTHRRELLLVAGIVAPLLLLFSVGWPQSSDGGWGPRAIVPLIPLLLVPAVWPMRDHRWGQRAAWLLGVLGAVVTWLGTAFDPSHFLAVVARVTRRSLRVNSGIAGQDEMLLTHFVPELNPILGHGWLSSRYLQRLRWHEESWYPWRTLNVPAWDVRTDPMPESGLNYWFDGSAAAWQLGIPVALVALVAAVLLVRAVRRAATTDAPARLARTA